MERIKNVMQRLQELYYSKHQKTNIDIDLMLDYTRVMYADLLEWRKDFKEEPQTHEAAEKNDAVVTSIAPPPTTAQVEEQQPEKEEPVVSEEESKEEESTEEDNKDEDREPAAPEEESKETESKEEENKEKEVKEEGKEEESKDHESKEEGKEEENNDEEPEETDKGQEDTETPEPEEAKIPKAHEVQPYQPIERDEPAPQEPMISDNEEPVVSETPEAEPIEALQGNLIGISFEPPAPIEKRHTIDDELLIEEPAVNETVEEIPVPVPQEIPLPEMKPAEQIELNVKPRLQQFTAPVQRKDIRKAIGINDTYLFLNELFNHQKNEYETTLDELNKMDTYGQAADWIKSKVAKENKWDKDDATVDSFYAMLSKHFSER